MRHSGIQNWPPLPPHPGSCWHAATGELPIRKPFLDGFCDHFISASVSPWQVVAPVNCFLAWFTLAFIRRPGWGKGKKVKTGWSRNRGRKINTTWQLLSAAETACMCLLECVCLRSTQAVQMRGPCCRWRAFFFSFFFDNNKKSGK